ncbi:MAG: hypothetical protein ACK6D1_07805 [Planctomycetota bacterium]
MRRPTRLAPALLLVAAAPAQWPAASSPNLPIGDFANEQVVNKVAATPDGGCYVGWFDNRNGGYAVWLQRFDAAGGEQWQHGGILVSNNPQSTSLIDWDLLADRFGHCVLTFTDTRAGGDLDVYAYRVTPAGAQAWGANGVTLSNNPDFDGNPRVCEAGDGDFVFVWSNSTTRTIQMQRLDLAGAPRFPGDGVAIPGDTGQSPAFARPVAASPLDGSVVVSWVRATSFSAAKHLHAQKFDALGQPLWNGGVRLPVFDQVSLPIAFDPRIASDGQGGAIFAWHFAVGSAFSARVQRVTAAGSEVFPHNGVDVSTNTNSKFDPAIVWQPATQSIQVAWNERNTAQTTWGIGAQSIDASGARQWGATGVSLLPIDTVTKFAPVAARVGAGMAVAVLVEDLGLLRKSVQLFGVDAAGGPRHAAVVASSFASDKLRLGLAATPSGTSLLAWTDQRTGAADVYGAAVDVAGNLGVTLATATVLGCTSPANSLIASGRPALGATIALGASNTLGSQGAGSTLAFVYLGGGPAPGGPCGLALPGFGMAPGQPGELLLDPGLPNVGLFAGVWTGPGATALPFAAPLQSSLLGLDVFAQGLLVDLAPATSVPFALTNGLRLRLGS